uniref:Uncharacterized protein n=1 Tax=Bradyrhizobium amphicarpaeae TaxID=1404768 RepID=A0A2U8Q4W4_9BRAD|nr:hypothetical protein CIT40_33005 [Bradyrhizobium amphicarpaeae]
MGHSPRGESPLPDPLPQAGEGAHHLPGYRATEPCQIQPRIHAPDAINTPSQNHPRKAQPWTSSPRWKASRRR